MDNIWQFSTSFTWVEYTPSTLVHKINTITRLVIDSQSVADILITSRHYEYRAHAGHHRSIMRHQINDMIMSIRHFLIFILHQMVWTIGNHHPASWMFWLSPLNSNELSNINSAKLIKSHLSGFVIGRIGLFDHVIYSSAALHCKQCMQWKNNHPVKLCPMLTAGYCLDEMVYVI